MRIRQDIKKTITVLSLGVFLTGCASTMASIKTVPATLGYVTAVHKDLVSLPPPKNKMVVAVYSFRDQTGQYKPQPNVTSFSTAVTQGATSMLIQALIDSGWFIPVEREGLPDLLTERKISRAAAMANQEDKSPLPSLIHAPLILEGGIVAYETNLVTGGFGAKYFGVGGSVETRRDQVTLYLRAVDVNDGRVLKSLSTTKSILSREIDLGIFRFIRLNHLLEVETGLSTNEPPQMCVLEAIEKAVYGMVVEGIVDHLWALKNPADIRSSPAILQYLKDKKGEMVQFDKDGNLVSLKGRSL